MTGIYKITSPTGKIYIGQSRRMHRRKKSYGWKCRTNQTMIYNSIKKHGWENHTFEVIHELPFDVDQKILDQYEKIYIEFYRQCGFYILNIREAGHKGKHSAETLAKISLALIGKAVGRKHSPETKSKISSAHKGRKFSDEWKAKIGITKIGNNYGGGCKWNVGRHHSPETIAKMRESAKKRQLVK